MNNSGDFSVQNFRSLIEKYENTILDATKELEQVHTEHNSIKDVLKENTQLRNQLGKLLAERINTPIEHKYKEHHLIENLQLQLKTLLHEKEQAVQLWQNAAAAVDTLEAEIGTYQDATEGLVPQTKLIQIKQEYETKVKELQNNVALTKTKLEELINQKTKELNSKDHEIADSLHSQNNAFKIIKNLEEEVLSLQQRLTDVNSHKKQLEKTIKHKGSEIESLKSKVQECKQMVQESLQVVEAALNEKDAAILRESKTQEEMAQISQTVDQVISETKTRVANLKVENEQKLDKILKELKLSQEEVKRYSKKCSFLEDEMEKLQRGLISVDESGASKMLILEKNLESTFQKLLLSEKENIKIKADMESVKSDLDQMARHYEMDVATREAEKSALKEEIKKLKYTLNENLMKLSQNDSTVQTMNENLTFMKLQFEEQMEEMKQEAMKEREAAEAEHKSIMESLYTQMCSQMEVNDKWRIETKNIIKCVERRIYQLKTALRKVKQENRDLNEKLRVSNSKVTEFRKLLELVSADVSKITGFALPEVGESER